MIMVIRKCVGMDAFSLALLSLLVSLAGADGMLARLPPMGWMSWARFTCEIEQSLYKSMAERLAEDGYSSLGYNHVHIDDCWSTKTRVDGLLVADPVRFSDGIQPLAEFVHERGLKLGIYGDCGLQTCGGYPGLLKSDSDPHDSYAHLDAKTFADWQVDSYKMDGCFIEQTVSEELCSGIASVFRNSSRDIEITCEWPFYMMYAHMRPDLRVAAKSCNTWRYYDDIEDSWANINNLIDYTVRHQSTMVRYHGPGHWFDPDQLVIGNFGLSRNQEEAQMAIWALWSAPLRMSNDLSRIRDESKAILQNQRLIQVDQDELGVLGLMVKSRQTDEGDILAFVKPVMPLTNGCPSFVLLYLNRRYLGREEKVSFQVAELLHSAPIEIAYEHQVELEGLKEMSEQSVRISASSCRRRLQQLDSPVRFQVSDLTRDVPPFHLSTKDSLELSVEPSGVRVVKLLEKED